MIPWNELHEILLHLHGIAVGREAEAQAKASHVGIDDDALVDVEGIAKDDVGGLASGSGNCGEFLHGGGDFASVAFHERRAHTAERLGFIPIESGGADDFLEFLLWDSCVVGGGLAALEEHLRHHVHPDIRALRGEDRGDEEFQRILEVEFAVGVRIDPGEFLRKPFGAFFFGHGMEGSLFPDTCGVVPLVQGEGKGTRHSG